MEIKLETIQYKCPNCGANLSFDAEKQGFSCEFCFSFFTEEDIKKIFNENESMALDENVQETQAQQDEFADHNSLYECPNCGAEIVSEETTSATFCCYCHNPVLLKGRLSGDFKPDKVIPFKIKRENAISGFKDWCGKKWFVPNAFKSEQQLEKMTGLYVPFWLADCSIHGSLNAIGKKIRTWSSGDYRYTETKEFSVNRDADLKMIGLPADGASKIDDDIMQAIEPFDYKDLKPFSMSYLSGFLADKYDVDKAGVFPRIKKRAEDGTMEILRNSTSGYDSLSVTSSNIQIKKTDWNYALLPVWFMNFKYIDKTYSFALNAQTGKLAGILPLSKAKLFGFCVGIVAVTTLLGTLGGYFFR